MPPPGSDPFVSVMLAVPKMLARRSSCDEPLQLHSIAYLATAAGYCCQRAEMGMTGWSSNPAGENPQYIGLGSLRTYYQHGFEHFARRATLDSNLQARNMASCDFPRLP